jgi:hypothetical protein
MEELVVTNRHVLLQFLWLAGIIISFHLGIFIILSLSGPLSFLAIDFNNSGLIINLENLLGGWHFACIGLNGGGGGGIITENFGSGRLGVAERRG